MGEQLYELTPEEEQLMIASGTNPNLFFQYWFEVPGGRPFQLDYGFDENPWQVDFCMAEESLVIAVAGVATGKTIATGMSALFHGATTPYFRFLNIGHELTQARYMYDELLRFIENTRFAKLVSKSPSSPHPLIEISYLIRGIRFVSTLEFKSAGEKSDGKNILSWRGDWINIEEAGRFSDLGSLVSILRTRLTGATASGRSYLGRLSLISNPIDNPELWEVFDRAASDTDAVTFMIDTASNKNVTEKQIKAQLKDIPMEEQDLWLKGERPEGRGAYFNRATVERCAQQLLSSKLKEGIAQGLPGYHGEWRSSLGYWHYRFPYEPDHQYIVVGDPGIGAAPLRNAPVVMAIDTIDAPRLNVVAALWWGNGTGRIAPFVTMFLDFLQTYKPVFAAIDATATQKNFNEVMNTEYIFPYPNDYTIDTIVGMDFTTGRKHHYLVSSRLTMEKGAVIWPGCATGIASQHKAYDPTEDTTATTSKLAQDIVSTMSMGLFASRRLYPPENDQEEEERPKESHRASLSRVRPARFRGRATRNTSSR